MAGVVVNLVKYGQGRLERDAYCPAARLAVRVGIALEPCLDGVRSRRDGRTIRGIDPGIRELV